MNRHNRSTIFPSAGGTLGAAGSVGHRQVILCPESRCVGRVGGWGDSVRDRAVIAPPGPWVLNACATALRRSCGNRVTRATHPGTPSRATELRRSAN
jgi:hypothetical protein